MIINPIFSTIASQTGTLSPSNIISVGKNLSTAKDTFFSPTDAPSTTLKAVLDGIAKDPPPEGNDLEGLKALIRRRNLIIDALISSGETIPPGRLHELRNACEQLLNEYKLILRSLVRIEDVQALTVVVDTNSREAQRLQGAAAKVSKDYHTMTSQLAMERMGGVYSLQRNFGAAADIYKTLLTRFPNTTKKKIYLGKFRIALLFFKIQKAIALERTSPIDAADAYFEIRALAIEFIGLSLNPTDDYERKRLATLRDVLHFAVREGVRLTEQILARDPDINRPSINFFYIKLSKLLESRGKTMDQAMIEFAKKGLQHDFAELRSLSDADLVQVITDYYSLWSTGGDGKKFTVWLRYKLTGNHYVLSCVGARPTAFEDGRTGLELFNPEKDAKAK